MQEKADLPNALLRFGEPVAGERLLARISDRSPRTPLGFFGSYWNGKTKTNLYKARILKKLIDKTVYP